MTHDTRGRPRWKKKRWIAAAALAVALAHPLSFPPACWVLMRLHPQEHQVAWRHIRDLFGPLAAMLGVCPDPVGDAIVAAINVGSTERAKLVRSDFGAGILIRFQPLEGGKDWTVCMSF